jgi:ABC-type glutathione transport system ATPase component
MTLATEDAIPCFGFGAQVAVLFRDEASKSDCVHKIAYAQPTGGISPRIREARALGDVGYVSHGHTLLSAFSVRDNVCMPHLYRGHLEKPEIMRRVVRLCDFGGFSVGILRREVSDLGALERVQTSFLQAAVGEPDLLLMDCIFEGLKPSDQAGVAVLVEGFRRLFPMRRMLYLGYALPPADHYAPTVVLTQESI